MSVDDKLLAVDVAGNRFKPCVRLGHASTHTCRQRRRPAEPPSARPPSSAAAPPAGRRAGWSAPAAGPPPAAACSSPRAGCSRPHPRRIDLVKEESLSSPCLSFEAGRRAGSALPVRCHGIFFVCFAGFILFAAPDLLLPSVCRSPSSRFCSARLTLALARAEAMGSMRLPGMASLCPALGPATSVRCTNDTVSQAG